MVMLWPWQKNGPSLAKVEITKVTIEQYLCYQDDIAMAKGCTQLS